VGSRKRGLETAASFVKAVLIAGLLPTDFFKEVRLGLTPKALTARKDDAITKREVSFMV
jgi:hypothetical protein